MIMISLSSIRTIAFHISNLDEISDISEAILYNELYFINSDIETFNLEQ